MTQFLLPVGLLAAAGILVPILLHLWRPPARTVRLGSLRFLERLPGRRLRDLRWRDRLLLLARCAVLLALAALLAEPQWLHRREGTQRWALLAPDAVLDDAAEREWRELLSHGYQPRRLASGFPGVDANSRTMATSASIDVWSLVREAVARVPSGSKLVVFAPTSLSSLRGARPVFAGTEVRWVAAKSAATQPEVWIDPASVTSNGSSVRATIGASDASATRFSIVRIVDSGREGTVSDPATGAALALRNTGGPLALRLTRPREGDWLPVINHRPIRVSIVHGADRSDDARNVAAAVRAVGEWNDRSVVVEVREESATKVIPESDWLFRLGSAPLTASQSSVLADDRVNVLSDAAPDAAAISRPSWFVAPGDPANINQIRLWRRSDASTPTGLAMWRDGFGKPLLTLNREGQAERWHFFSRFHPEWSDWTERDSFPAWMQSLLLRREAAASLSSHDRRLVDVQQAQPSSTSAGTISVVLPAATGSSRDLRFWAWTLVAALLALERALSLRSRTGPAPAPAPKPAPRELEVVP